MLLQLGTIFFLQLVSILWFCFNGKEKLRLRKSALLPYQNLVVFLSNSAGYNSIYFYQNTTRIFSKTFAEQQRSDYVKQRRVSTSQFFPSVLGFNCLTLLRFPLRRVFIIHSQLITFLLNERNGLLVFNFPFLLSCWRHLLSNHKLRGDLIKASHLSAA